MIDHLGHLRRPVSVAKKIEWDYAKKKCFNQIITWYSLCCPTSLQDFENTKPNKYTMNIDVLK